MTGKLQDSEPIFYVLVCPAGGTEAQRVDATDMILSFEFEEDEKKTDQLKLTIDNWNLEHFDTPLWRAGNRIICTWGYPGKMAPSRECIIQKVEGSIQITVTAQSKALLMNKDVKVKLYENTRRSEIVHAIAKDYGFGDDQRFIEETETPYEHISQARQTDAQFIKRLADAEHFEFYVDFSGLHWHPRKMGQKPLRVLQYYLPPDVGDVLDWNVENDPFAKPTQVVVKGRDPANKGATTTAQGSNVETERIALIKPDSGASGGFGTVPLTPAATAPAATPNASPGKGTGNLDPTAQLAVTPTTETHPAQIKKQADGAFKRATQVAVKLSLNMVGDPFVIAKSVVDIRGISKRLSGLYYINSANHKIDSGGYKLSLKCTTDSTHGHSQDLLATKKQPPKPSKATPNPAKPGETKDPGATTPVATIDPTSGSNTGIKYIPDGPPPPAPATPKK